jgi:hypothetical protein
MMLFEHIDDVLAITSALPQGISAGDQPRATPR